MYVVETEAYDVMSTVARKSQKSIMKRIYNVAKTNLSKNFRIMHKYYVNLQILKHMLNSIIKTFTTTYFSPVTLNLMFHIFNVEYC